MNDTTSDAPTYAALQSQVIALTNANNELSQGVISNIRDLELKTSHINTLQRRLAAAIRLLREAGWEGDVSTLDA
jgi:hypothetical protein